MVEINVVLSVTNFRPGIDVEILSEHFRLFRPVSARISTSITAHKKKDQILTEIPLRFQWVTKYGKLMTGFWVKIQLKSGQVTLHLHQPNFDVNLWSELMLFVSDKISTRNRTSKFYERISKFFCDLNSTRFWRRFMVEINVILSVTKFRPEIVVEILSKNFTIFSTGLRHQFVVEIWSIYDAFVNLISTSIYSRHECWSDEWQNFDQKSTSKILQIAQHFFRPNFDVNFSIDF